MRVFVTGASGYVGSAVAAALARGGHEVSGLARSEASARRLAAAEMIPVTGDMSEPDGLRAAAREADAIVHCAADWSPRFHELDRLATSALLEAAATGDRPRLVVYTSGVWLYGDTGGRAVDEASPLAPPELVAPRVEVERMVLAASRGRLRTLVLRPGCLYGGRGGLTAAWFAGALREGAPRIVGDGANRWSMVHVDDVAAAYRAAVESKLGGDLLNLSEPTGATVRECAAAASRAAGGDGTVVSLDPGQAAAAFGPMAVPLAFSQVVDSGKAGRLLGWRPRHAGFVAEAARCFAAWQARGAS
jgi:nucleoside-diphosphate-sugar epimerase